VTSSGRSGIWTT